MAYKVVHYAYRPHTRLVSCPIAIAYSMGQIIQVAQLSQRDRAAGWVSYGQKWKTGTGRQYFTDTIGLSLTTET